MKKYLKLQLRFYLTKRKEKQMKLDFQAKSNVFGMAKHVMH